MNIVLDFILNIWFLWLPFILGIAFFKVWGIYSKGNFVESKIEGKYKMLEISIPREVSKSPQAMELAIDVLWHLGGGVMAPKDRFFYGAVFIPSSLEIVSIEGSIYFFIRAHVQVADLIKSTVYSQYPNAEINEVDDYTKYVPDFAKNEDTWDLYGADFRLDEESFIPIKTYVDYGLDKSAGVLDEEHKIDPITPLLEYLGTLRKGEQIWIQFVVRSAIFNKWRKDAKAYIEEVMGRAKEVADDEPFQTLKLTHGEQETIKGIERSLSKHGFETVIRTIYIAPKENFDKGRVGFFKNNIFKPFNSMYLNKILRSAKEDTSFVDYKYQDVTGLRTPALKRRIFNNYINREAFYEGFWRYFNFLWHERKEPMVLTGEELATLFHIPGQVATTSSLERIDATKSEAPSNLPT